MSSNVKFEDYRFEIRPLSMEDGGGFLVSFPDLPGCISDGETYEEAIANARDAFAAWIAAHEEEGREIPAPNGEGKPAKFVLRLPRSLHERLGTAAAAEGTSVNTFVTMFVAEGLARREEPASQGSFRSTTLVRPKGSTSAPASRGTMVHLAGKRLVSGALAGRAVSLDEEKNRGFTAASDDLVVIPIRRVRG